MLNSNNFAEQNWKCETKIRRDNFNQEKDLEISLDLIDFFFSPFYLKMCQRKNQKAYPSPLQQSSGPHQKLSSDFAH